MEASREEAMERSSSGQGPGSEGRDPEAESLAEHSAHAQAHIACIEEQLQSAWATGLSDDPPPGYECRTPQNSWQI
jgi:hypothetical protein